VRVGVTGAGGYVGRAAVGVLVAGGHSVVALDRRPAAPPFAGPVRFVAADVRDRAALEALAAQTDAVVHLAAYVHRAAATAAARVECFAVNEGATCALIVAMAASGRRQHLVLASTIAVYGDSFEDADEDYPLQPATPYAESKLAAERAALEAAHRGEITAVVLRPAVVYGPRAPGNLTKLVHLVRRGPVPLVRSGANAKSMVHVDDLAAAIVRAVEAGARVNGRVFNVAGPALTVRETVEAIARGTGRPARWLPVPGWLFGGAAATAGGLARASGGRLPDLGRSLEVFTGTATVDASAAARELGVVFRPPAPSLAEVARTEPAE
jgi:nucleoside-diphosphate-sugar epimerase